MSILFVLDKKPTFVPAGDREAWKGSLWRSSLEFRASGTVDLRWQAVFGSSDRLDHLDIDSRVEWTEMKPVLAVLEEALANAEKQKK